MRTLSLTAACVAAAAVLAGCGGGGSSTTAATQTFNEVADAAYQRSYTDCGSVDLIDLAHRYKVKPQRDIVAVAVATYWADQVHGGDTAIEAGKEGCYDGFKARR